MAPKCAAAFLGTRCFRRSCSWPAAIAASSIRSGPSASAEKTILINSTAIMLAIIIPTMVATIAFAWWFRRGNRKATYRPDWEYSGAIEMVVWSIPR